MAGSEEQYSWFSEVPQPVSWPAGYQVVPLHGIPLHGGAPQHSYQTVAHGGFIAPMCVGMPPVPLFHMPGIPGFGAPMGPVYVGQQTKPDARPLPRGSGKALRELPMLRPPPRKDIASMDKFQDNLDAILDLPAHVLTSRIKDASSLGRLHALSLASWCHMNSIHVSAFICKAARLMSSGRQDGMQWWAAQEWFSALLREAFQIQQDLKPREVANIAWACAKVQQALTQQGSALEPALLQALCSAVHAVLGNMDAQGLANSLWSLSKLQVGLSRDWLMVFNHALEARLSDFNEQELSNTLLGLAQLATRELRDLVLTAAHMVIRESCSKMATFSTQGLSNTVWAVSKLNINPSAEWLKVFLKACVESIDGFTPQGLSNTLAGLAALHARLSPKFWEVAVASVTANAATFSAPAISTTLNAFATLDLPAPTEAVSALVAQMQATLQGFGSPALASTIWSLAKLGHAMTAKERQSLIQRLEEVAMDLGPQDVTNCLQALCAPIWGASSWTIDRLCCNVEAVASRMQGAQVASVLSSLATLRHMPSAGTVAALAAAFATTLASMQETELVSALQGMTALNFSSRAAAAGVNADYIFSSAAAYVSGAIAGGTSPSFVAGALHALAHLAPATLTASLVGAALASLGPEPWPLRSTAALQLAIALKEHLGAAAAANEDPAPGAEDAIASLAEAAGAAADAEAPNPLRGEVLAILRDVGVPALPLAPILGSLYVADALIPTSQEALEIVNSSDDHRSRQDRAQALAALGPDHSAVLFVDGPSRFASNSAQPLGPTLLRNSQLLRASWKLLLVPFTRWAALAGAKARADFLASCVDNLGLTFKIPVELHVAYDMGPVAEDSVHSPSKSLSAKAAPFVPSLASSGPTSPTTPSVHGHGAARRVPFTPGERLEVGPVRVGKRQGRTPRPNLTSGKGAPMGDENAPDALGGPATVTPTPVKVREVLKRGAGRAPDAALTRVEGITLGAGPAVTPMGAVLAGVADVDRATAGPHKSPLPMGRTPKPAGLPHGRAAQETPSLGKASTGHGDGKASRRHSRTRSKAPLTERQTNVLEF